MKQINSVTRTIRSLLQLEKVGIISSKDGKILRESLQFLSSGSNVNAYKCMQKLSKHLSARLTKEFLLTSSGGPAILEAARMNILLEAGDDADDNPFDTGDDAPADDASDDTASEDAPDSEDAGDSEDADSGSDSGGGGGSSSGDSSSDDSEENPDDEEKDDKEEKKPVSIEDQIRLSKSIDDALEAVLVDYETDARKTAQIKNKGQNESKRKLSLRRLFEADGDYEDKFDINSYTTDIARLVKNYDNLLDMESIIVNKSREFIVTKYGESAAAAMDEILKTKFSIDVKLPEQKPEEEPIAVGARDSGTTA